MPLILTPALVGALYSYEFGMRTTEGYSVTESVTAGSLPPGLILSDYCPDDTHGLLSGTPTVAGTYLFTITFLRPPFIAPDAVECSLVVYDGLLLNSSIANSGSIGTPYSQTVSASGGAAPYSFTVTSGVLPSGFSLDAATGILSGTPIIAGSSAFTLTVTDSAGFTASANLSITISPLPGSGSSTGSTFIPLAASGGCAPVLLVEVETASGNSYFWSEHKCIWPSILTGIPEQFLDWVVGQPKFTLFGSTQTDTASLAVQNISGNTVTRDVATAWSQNEFIGALVVCRLWRGDAESSCFTFIGTVAAAEIDESRMQLTLEGFGNFSDVAAPAYDIDVTCPLTFGSVACGSTSPTPCDLTYGGCSSINRFAGVVTQWDQECPNVQYAQPAPAVFYNPARTF
jgi:hypothetical protein